MTVEAETCDLSQKHCVPCRGGVPPLEGAAITKLRQQLPQGWDVVREHHLTKTFQFKDFVTGLAYVNRVGAIAEEEGHHPDIYLAWGHVRLDIWTHKVDGLTESDFIFAAKADRAL